MVQEMGESREAWGWDVVRMVEDFAQNLKKEDKPFYIVYACKEDKGASNRLGRTAFKQTIKAYYARPPAILGVLVWYCNHATGEFSFIPELSSPPDVPLDPSLLSTKSEDSFGSIANQGKKLNVLVS